MGRGDLSTFRLNGEPLPALPYKVSSTTIARWHSRGNGLQVTVGGAIQAKLRWDGRHSLDVYLSEGSVLLDNTCGLCGDADGDRSDEEAHVAQHEHWHVGREIRLFPENAEADICADPPLPDTHPCDTEEGADRTAAEAHCEIIRSTRYSGCAEILDPTQYFDDCVFDFCIESEDDDCATVAAYEEDCRLAGATFDAMLDVCGVCGGDDSACTGCDGVPNSNLVHDDCGVCAGNNDCVFYPCDDGTLHPRSLH